MLLDISGRFSARHARCTQLSGSRPSNCGQAAICDCLSSAMPALRIAAKSAAISNALNPSMPHTSQASSPPEIFFSLLGSLHSSCNDGLWASTGAFLECIGLVCHIPTLQPHMPQLKIPLLMVREVVAKQHMPCSMHRCLVRSTYHS